VVGSIRLRWIDLHRRLDQSVVDVHAFHVLDVTEPRRQRHTGDVALCLRSDVEINGPLQPVARAGNLCEAGRRREQRACEHNADESDGFHRNPPPHMA